MDIEAWRRSFGPAMRVFGYMTGIFALAVLLFIFPLYAIVYGFGLPEEIYNDVGGMIIFLVLAFSFPLSIFKVQAEMSPGVVPLEMSN